MRATRFELRRLAAIYAGGTFGALLRVGLAQAAPQGPGEWPWATFAVNMIGALLLGWFVARLRDHPEDSLVHPFLTTGICGTLTTFSNWILDSHRLAEAGHNHLVWLNIALSLVAGFAAVALGHWLGGVL
jgi:fluoride exporter